MGIIKSTSSVCFEDFIQKSVDPQEDRNKVKYGQKEFSPISPKLIKINGDKIVKCKFEQVMFKL